MSDVKLGLSRKVPIQIDQGKNVVTMCGEVMSPTEPAVMTLNTTNLDLQTKHANLIEARAAVGNAKQELKASSAAQRTAYNNLGALVQTHSNGEASFITSCGFELRASGGPTPPVEDAPGNLTARVNGVPGVIHFSWGSVLYARNYEVQTTTDLSGATGWTSQPEMPGVLRLEIPGLVSGTKYALRVRAWGKSLPGPWSTLIQQMAP